MKKLQITPNIFCRNQLLNVSARWMMFLFAITLGFSVQAQDKRNEHLYRTMDLSREGVKEVEVETSGGNISVSGGEGQARLEVLVSRNNGRSGDALSDEEIKNRIEKNYDLTLTASGGKLVAKARPRRNNMNWREALGISFRLVVPPTTTTDLATSGGNINLENLSGTQRFTTSGGNLNLQKLAGKIKGSTSGGNINITGSRDEIELTTSGGNIYAENCTGNLRLTTSGGSLQLSNLNGQIKAGTSGGDVRGSSIEGELSAATSGGSISLKDLRCSVEAATSAGHIDVAITSLGKYVRLSNSGGDISLQLPRNKGVDLDLRGDRVKTATLASFNGAHIEDERIEGKLNGGGVPVRVRAGGGRVELSFN